MSKKPLLVFLGICFAGFIGMLIDSYVGFDGNLSVVVSLGVLGTILVSDKK